jgi:hypothetical protein
MGNRLDFSPAFYINREIREESLLALVNSSGTLSCNLYVLNALSRLSG